MMDVARLFFSLAFLLTTATAFVARPTVTRTHPLSAATDLVDVVLFNVGDLRVDDHVGLQKAMDSGHKILPLFVMNTATIQNLPGAHAHTLDTIQLLASAVEELQSSLKETYGLPLYCDTSLDCLSDTNVNNIYVCDLGKVDNELGYTVRPNDERCVSWNSFLRQRPWQSVTLPNSYPTYQTQFAKYSALSPTVMNANPSIGEERAFDLPNKNVFDEDSLTKLFQEACGGEQTLSRDEVNTGLFATHWGGLPSSSVGCQSVLKVLQQSNTPRIIPTATANPQSLEHATMQWQEPSNWQNQEATTRYLLAPLFFGTVSPRRVWQCGRPPSPFAPDPLRQLVEAQEWHELLAAKCDENTDNGNNNNVKYWRYHGMLCRYVDTPMKKDNNNNSNEDDTGILLVHGFGASGTQWNKSMNHLQSFSQGLAPDLLGFGRSEKPGLSYTGYLWDSFVLDFVKEVAVKKYGWNRYVTGGNSIGGFTSMSLAACDAAQPGELSSSGAPGTGKCDGLVLMNSAGPILNRDELLDPTTPSVAEQTIRRELEECKPPARPVARAIGNILLTYLRPSIKNICTNLYPTNPDAVDTDLCQSIERDSLDPGAVYVMMAGAKLPPPRTANELLNADFGASSSGKEGTFDGAVLVAQGVLDPLNDAKDRMERLGSLREGITMDPINAGHCPHDELPDKVAQSIDKWMQSRSSSRKTTIESKMETSTVGR